MLSVVLTYVLQGALAIILCTLCVLHTFSPFDYWKKRGVPQVKVKYPIIGNSLDLVSKSVCQIFQDIYYSFPDERFVGTYQFNKPTLLIRDPDLVECVLIKDFQHFQKREISSDPNESLVTKSIARLEGDRWKNQRAKLLPIFTSAKLKGMHSRLMKCVEVSMEFLKKFENGRPFQVDDVISRYTSDVVACCAFGLSPGAETDLNSEFQTVGSEVSKVSHNKKFFFLITPIVRPLLKFFKVRSVPRKHADFVVNTVNSILEHRKRENIECHDFLHLLNELRNKDKQMVENKRISANDPDIFDDASLYSGAFMFLVTGYSTTLSVMRFVLYVLATNQDVQNRLFNEVRRVVDEHKNEISHEAVQQMVFLNQVILETMRLYPTGSTLSRTVTKEYRVPGTDLVLPEGMVVRIPVHAIQQDPQYFPEPQKFIPDRFDEKKNTIRKGTYEPFGGGPRMCVASRFAMQQMKLWFASLVMHYKILRSEKMQEPLTFERHSVTLKPKGGIWVATEPRV